MSTGVGVAGHAFPISALTGRGMRRSGACQMLPRGRPCEGFPLSDSHPLGVVQLSVDCEALNAASDGEYEKVPKISFTTPIFFQNFVTYITNVSFLVNMQATHK